MQEGIGWKDIILGIFIGLLLFAAVGYLFLRDGNTRKTQPFTLKRLSVQDKERMEKFYEEKEKRGEKR